MDAAPVSARGSRNVDLLRRHAKQPAVFAGGPERQNRVDPRTAAAHEEYPQL